MLITPEEKKRLEEIAAVAVEGNNVKRGDIVWLCELTQRLARLKPTEEDFPTCAALINPAAIAAFALGFLETIPVEQTTSIIGPFKDGRADLLDILTEAEVCEAALCVRPYIRLIEPRTEAMLDRLARLGRVSVAFNNHKVIDEGSVEEHLIGFDGYGLRRKPFRFRELQKLPVSADVFGVGEIDMESGEAVLTERGVFVPGGTTIKICLSGFDLEEGETVRVSTGLVMGRYSTKVPGIPLRPPILKDEKFRGI